MKLHAIGLCFCMNSGYGLHLNTLPAKRPFFFWFPGSTDMLVSVDELSSGITHCCFHTSHQSLKCQHCCTWQLLPIGCLTVSWLSCSQDAVQEFLVSSQTLRATDIQVRISQAETHIWCSWIWLNRVTVHRCVYIRSKCSTFIKSKLQVMLCYIFNKWGIDYHNLHYIVFELHSIKVYFQRQRAVYVILPTALQNCHFFPHQTDESISV